MPPDPIITLPGADTGEPVSVFLGLTDVRKYLQQFIRSSLLQLGNGLNKRTAQEVATYQACRAALESLHDQLNAFVLLCEQLEQLSADNDTVSYRRLMRPQCVLRLLLIVGPWCQTHQELFQQQWGVVIGPETSWVELLLRVNPTVRYYSQRVAITKLKYVNPLLSALVMVLNDDHRLCSLHPDHAVAITVNAQASPWARVDALTVMLAVLNMELDRARESGEPLTTSLESLGFQLRCALYTAHEACERHALDWQVFEHSLVVFNRLPQILSGAAVQAAKRHRPQNPAMPEEWSSLSIDWALAAGYADSVLTPMMQLPPIVTSAATRVHQLAQTMANASSALTLYQLEWILCEQLQTLLSFTADLRSWLQAHATPMNWEVFGHILRFALPSIPKPTSMEQLMRQGGVNPTESQFARWLMQFMMDPTLLTGSTSVTLPLYPRLRQVNHGNPQRSTEPSSTAIRQAFSGITQAVVLQGGRGVAQPLTHFFVGLVCLLNAHKFRYLQEDIASAQDDISHLPVHQLFNVARREFEFCLKIMQAGGAYPVIKGDTLQHWCEFFHQLSLAESQCIPYHPSQFSRDEVRAAFTFPVKVESGANALLKAVLALRQQSLMGPITRPVTPEESHVGIGDDEQPPATNQDATSLVPHLQQPPNRASELNRREDAPRLSRLPTRPVETFSRRASLGDDRRESAGPAHRIPAELSFNHIIEKYIAAIAQVELSLTVFEPHHAITQLHAQLKVNALRFTDKPRTLDDLRKFQQDQTAVCQHTLDAIVQTHVWQQRYSNAKLALFVASVVTTLTYLCLYCVLPGLLLTYPATSTAIVLSLFVNVVMFGLNWVLTGTAAFFPVKDNITRVQNDIGQFIARVESELTPAAQAIASSSLSGVSGAPIVPQVGSKRLVHRRSASNDVASQIDESLDVTDPPTIPLNGPRRPLARMHG